MSRIISTRRVASGEGFKANNLLQKKFSNIIKIGLLKTPISPMTRFILLFLSSFAASTVFAETDYCQQALENLYTKESNLISVIKINTNKASLYSSTVETSKDCQNYIPLFSVKNPDAIKTQGGLCAILPADEIKPGLCSLHMTLCISEKDCQSLTIKLTTENNHYTHADPAYYEMDFNN